MTIHKQSISNFKSVTKLMMPRGSQILAFQTQHHIPCIWYLCDSSYEMEERTFQVFGTGWENIPTEGYIGTFQDGNYVWHVFEITVK